MKYIVDTDALINCIDCLQGMIINNKVYIQVETIKGFIERFPKDELTVLNASSELEKQA